MSIFKLLALYLLIGDITQAYASPERLGEREVYLLEDQAFDSIPRYEITNLDPTVDDFSFIEGLPISFFPESFVREDIRASIEILGGDLSREGEDASNPFLYGKLYASYESYPTSLYGNGFDSVVITQKHHYFCGSGGCTTHIFTKDGSNWKKLLEIFGCEVNREAWFTPPSLDPHIKQICISNRGEDAYEDDRRLSRYAEYFVVIVLVLLAGFMIWLIVKSRSQRAS
jgi:hypothetical protein